MPHDIVQAKHLPFWPYLIITQSIRTELYYSRKYCSYERVFLTNVCFFFLFLFCLHVGLPDGIIDVVIASQSFHWFANTEALKEIHRVLVRDGLLGIVWAIPDYTVPWWQKFGNSLHPCSKKSLYLYPMVGSGKKCSTYHLESYSAILKKIWAFIFLCQALLTKLTISFPIFLL